MNRAGRHDHLLRFDLLAVGEQHADCAPTVEQHTVDQRIAAYGLLRALNVVGRDSEGSRRRLSYRAEVGEHFLLLSFVLNRDGNVAELSLEEEE